VFSYILMSLLWLCYGFAMALVWLWYGFGMAYIRVIVIRLMTRPEIAIQIKE